MAEIGSIWKLGLGFSYSHTRFHEGTLLSRQPYYGDLRNKNQVVPLFSSLFLLNPKVEGSREEKRRERRRER